MDFLQANFWFSTDKFLVDYENGGTPKWFEIWGTPKRLGTPHLFQNLFAPGKEQEIWVSGTPKYFFWGGVQPLVGRQPCILYTSLQLCITAVASLDYN